METLYCFIEKGQVNRRQCHLMMVKYTAGQSGTELSAIIQVIDHEAQRMINKSCTLEGKKPSPGRFAVLSEAAWFPSVQTSFELVKGTEVPLMPRGKQLGEGGSLLREQGMYFGSAAVNLCLSCEMTTALPAFCLPSFLSAESSSVSIGQRTPL